ncbi:MAG: MFS transporter [Hyphomonadaceae bacterium]|nr:MFS transporter [Hyphomonadaceae bacterium]
MDPRQIINDGRMSAVQIAAVAITVGLNALDGFDVLAISFASPGIAAEWGIERGALGIVLSMELVGMAFGSILLGGVADRIGRRVMILASLVLMAIGMMAVTYTSSIVELSLWRVLTGVGIGGMIPCLNAMAAEYSNGRNRRLALSLMVIGYPGGVVLGGTIAALLLKDGGWRDVFHFGALVTALFIPLVFFLLQETPQALAARRGPNALEKINKQLARMKLATISELPAAQAKTAALPLASLFSKNLFATTLLVTLGYFGHIVVFYYVAKWTPSVVVDMGFQPSQAAGVLVWLSIGGVIGGGLFGIVAQRTSLKALTAIVLALTTGMLFVYGQGAKDLQHLSLVAAATGVVIQAGIVGIYTITAEAFPAYARAAGTGFVIGAGRAGALLAPILAGFLFQAGLNLFTVSVTIGMASLVGAALILMARLDKANASG